MNKLVFVSAIASILANSVAVFAQGLPSGTIPPTYGSRWTADHLKFGGPNIHVPDTGQPKIAQETLSARTGPGESSSLDDEPQPQRTRSPSR